MSNIMTKDIPGYEGLYQATSYGKIIALPKKITLYNGGSYWTRKKILKTFKSRGYLQVGITKNGKLNVFKVHKLICLTFHGKRPTELVTDHIDGNKTNNNISNLRYVTFRDNTCFAIDKKNTSSIYHGVSFRKNQKNPYQSSIDIDGKTIYLGCFDNEKEASKAYEKCLAAYLSNQSIKQFLKPKKKAAHISKYTGINWHKGTKKWTVTKIIDKKEIYIGCYKTEIEAIKASIKASICSFFLFVYSF